MIFRTLRHVHLPCLASLMVVYLLFFKPYFSNHCIDFLLNGVAPLFFRLKNSFFAQGRFFFIF